MKTSIGTPGDRPFSPALAAGPFVFVSGQVGIDAQTGKVAGPDIEAQTLQTLKNVEGLLQQAGLGLDDVVKTTVFLTDMSEFARMSAVYRSCFGVPLPTRSTVEVSALARAGLKVEIEAIALRREGELSGAVRTSGGKEAEVRRK